MSHNSELKFSHMSIWRAFPLNYRSWLWFSVSPMSTVKSYYISPGLREAFSVHLWNIVKDFHYNTQSYLYRWRLLGTGTNKGWTSLGYFSFMHIVDFVSHLISSVLTNRSLEPRLWFAVFLVYVSVLTSFTGLLKLFAFCFCSSSSVWYLVL